MISAQFPRMKSAACIDTVMMMDEYIGFLSFSLLLRAGPEGFPSTDRVCFWSHVFGFACIFPYPATMISRSVTRDSFPFHPNSQESFKTKSSAPFHLWFQEPLKNKSGWKMTVSGGIRWVIWCSVHLFAAPESSHQSAEMKKGSRAEESPSSSGALYIHPVCMALISSFCFQHFGAPWLPMAITVGHNNYRSLESNTR